MTAALAWPAAASASAVWNASQRRGERAEVGLAALDPHAEQRQRREQAARAGIGDELAEERLRVDGAVHQSGQVSSSRNSSPLVSR